MALAKYAEDILERKMESLRDLERSQQELVEKAQEPEAKRVLKELWGVYLDALETLNEIKDILNGADEQEILDKYYGAVAGQLQDQEKVDKQNKKKIKTLTTQNIGLYKELVRLKKRIVEKDNEILRLRKLERQNCQEAQRERKEEHIKQLYDVNHAKKKKYEITCIVCGQNVRKNKLKDHVQNAH